MQTVNIESSQTRTGYFASSSRWLLRSACVVAASLLVACGGGGDSAPAAGSGGGSVAAAPAAVPPPPDSGGASCGVATELFTGGNVFEAATRLYRPDASVLGTQRTRTVNTAGVTFNGVSTVESAGSGTTTIATPPSVTAGRFTSYNNIVGSAVPQHGIKLPMGSIEVTTTYSPLLLRALSPALGTVESQSVVQTMNESGPGAAAGSRNSTFSITRTAQAIETITIPAGTVSVCRSSVDTVDDGVTSQQTQYTLAVGACRGQIARLVDRPTGRVLFEMTSASWNGASCTAPAAS